MMICAADFEELFPDLFQSELVPAVQPTGNGPSAERIARWEDDGVKRLAPVPQGRTAPVHRPALGYDMKRMVVAGAIVASVPAAATYAAVSAMRSAYDTMTIRRDVMF